MAELWWLNNGASNNSSRNGKSTAKVASRLHATVASTSLAAQI